MDTDKRGNGQKNQDSNVSSSYQATKSGHSDLQLDDEVAEMVDNYLREQAAIDNLSESSRAHRFHRLLNNKYVNILLVLILVSLLIWIFSKIAYLFGPLIAFIQIISLPIIFAAVLYYLSVPLVNYLEKRGANRIQGTIIVFIIIGLVLAAFASLVPVVINQGQDFARDWTSIWAAYQSVVTNLIGAGWYRELQTLFVNGWESLQSLEGFNLTALANSTLAGLGSLVGTVTRVIVALITAPIILFYMLRDGHNFPQFLLGFVPGRIRGGTYKLFNRMNSQISLYIRGQITVAAAVSVMFVIGYLIIGLPYGVIIGVLAGFLNIIPYLGSFLAIIPALIVGIVVSPFMLLKVLIVFAIEQTIESRVISPLILGSNLDIHPVTIMLLLISGANLFGFVGLILIIPVYAVLKVIMLHIFEWYRNVSGLYDDDLDIAESFPQFESDHLKKGPIGKSPTEGYEGAKIDEEFHHPKK